MARRELLLTGTLIGLCLLVTAVALWPRLGVQHPTVAQSQPDITVAVKGAVMEPGSYELPWGARVEDAITAAGGFAPQADRNLVNLAALLDTGDTVFVPNVRTDTGERRISINGATPAELDALPGVGPAIAERIIRGRPYSTVEELLEVKGIGPATLEKLRPFITL